MEERVEETVIGKAMAVDVMVVNETLLAILTKLHGTASVGLREVEAGEAEKLEEILEAKRDVTIAAPERKGAERDIVGRNPWNLEGGRSDQEER